jgi:hypothetical protein
VCAGRGVVRGGGGVYETRGLEGGRGLTWGFGVQMRCNA